jgi:Secretion system C-terminal sorting domain
MATLSTFFRGAAVCAFLTVAFQAQTNSRQPPTGRTGAPGQATCIACHVGTPLNGGGGAITVTGIPARGFVPGTTYPVTVTITDPTATRFGFELTILDSSNLAQAGQMVVTTANRTLLRTSAGIGYMSHLNANSQNTWTFNWTAPASGTSEINLYAAGNGANNNGGSSGDHIYTTRLNIRRSTSTGFADDALRAEAQLMAFPNPATDRLQLLGTALGSARALTLHDALGRQIRQIAPGTAELDVQALPAGSYTLRLITAEGQNVVRPLQVVR